MKISRISLALDTGALILPDTGRIAVFRPRSDEDLSGLPQDRVHVIQGFKPDHDAFVAQGYDTGVAPSGDYAVAIVFIPRAKAEARALIAEAADRVGVDGLVLVDGQKTDGIDSVFKDCRKHASVSPALSKAHGKLFWFAAGIGFADWAATGPTKVAGGFQTVAGVFSADGVDRGSAALAAALPDKLPNRVVDLGAGWGYLSFEILKRESVKELHLVEAEHAALECARANITDPRAQFHWADGTAFKLPRQPVDLVVTNPPFHMTRAADPNIGRAFINAAAEMLSPPGHLLLVANRHLPYEKTLAEMFRTVEEVAGGASFKVLRATHPLRHARPGR
jgi:16S rRNA (guanine1207-N2)-methyltransferase